MTAGSLRLVSAATQLEVIENPGTPDGGGFCLYGKISTTKVLEPFQIVRTGDNDSYDTPSRQHRSGQICRRDRRGLRSRPMAHYAMVAALPDGETKAKKKSKPKLSKGPKRCPGGRAEFSKCFNRLERLTDFGQKSLFSVISGSSQIALEIDLLRALTANRVAYPELPKRERYRVAGNAMTAKDSSKARAFSVHLNPDRIAGKKNLAAYINQRLRTASTRRGLPPELPFTFAIHSQPSFHVHATIFVDPQFDQLLRQVGRDVGGPYRPEGHRGAPRQIDIKTRYNTGTNRWESYSTEGGRATQKALEAAGSSQNYVTISRTAAAMAEEYLDGLFEDAREILWLWDHADEL